MLYASILMLVLLFSPMPEVHGFDPHLNPDMFLAAAVHMIVVGFILK